MDSGQILANRYQIIHALGQGGFSTTYLAKDLDLPNQRLCVVKKINPQVPNSETWQTIRRLFQTEAEILSKLGSEHDQIPELYAYFEETDALYLVQEFINGSTLDIEFKDKGKYQEEEVIILLKDILEILAFVHSKGVIHRDIKPSNLIRRKADEKLVLIDFGAVKEIGTLANQFQLQSTFTIAIGSVGYMAMEQSLGRPTFSSDVYSVGIIGIVALTTLHPTELYDHFSNEILWREQAEVSEEFANVLDTMVRSNFQERYSSAKEVLLAINYLRGQTNIHVTQLHSKSQSSTSLEQEHINKAKRRAYAPVYKKYYRKIQSPNTLLLLSFLLTAILLFSAFLSFIAISIWSNTLPVFPNLFQIIFTFFQARKIEIIVGFITSVTGLGIFILTKRMLTGRNTSKISPKIFQHESSFQEESIPSTYADLVDIRDEFLKEIKDLYRKMLEMQETHNTFLKEVIVTNHNQITRLIEQSGGIKDSEGLRSYTIQGNTNYIHFPEQEAQMSVEHSDQSRNIEVGGDFTLSQTGSTLNLGEISGNVTNQIKQLPDDEPKDNHLSLKDLLTRLQKAIEEDNQLPPQDKADLLEEVKTLAEAKQTKEPEKKQGMIRRAKKIFDATLKGLPDTAKIVDACSKLLPLILKALGIA